MAAGGRRGSDVRRRQWWERRERRRRERRERHTPSTVTHLHHHRRVRSWQRTAGATAAALTAEDGEDVEAGALVRDSGGEVGPILRGPARRVPTPAPQWLPYGGCPLAATLAGPGGGRVLVLERGGNLLAAVLPSQRVIKRATCKTIVVGHLQADPLPPS
ncbi:hypothetical protein OsJ_23429 [Oryza sativa Japonica Group]|uniref:Uncharacterized protein n=1 Tax=Oryza sativa subsp. japonica TaxID=39947 RepID=A3BHH0_ORYSJ|nr:hypothetical protein OsJ_23429 [Oryza sativa Japonica Group]